MRPVWRNWLPFVVHGSAYAWLLGWGYYLYRSQAQHPSHWPVTLAFGVMFAMGLLQAGQVIYAWSRRKSPRRHLALLFAMLACTTLFAYGGAYVHRITLGRHIPNTLLVRWMASIGATVGNLERKLRYPIRYSSPRIEMYCQAPIDNASLLLADADEYMASLERELRSSAATQVHWIRGDLLGRGGYQFLGMAMSDIQWEGDDSHASFNWVDRHELAHFAIHSRVNAASQPPFVLVEGWAQAKSQTQEQLYSDAWSARYHDDQPWQLDVLTTHPWYELDRGPVYSIGGALVHYLLAQYGAEKFLDLYIQCNQGNFHERFVATYGKSVSQIEVDLWYDIEAELAGKLSQYKWSLNPQSPPAGVDAQLWQEMSEAINRQIQFSQQPIRGEYWESNTKTAWTNGSVATTTRIWWTNEMWWQQVQTELQENSQPPSTQDQVLGLYFDDKGHAIAATHDRKSDTWKRDENLVQNVLDPSEYLRHVQQSQIDSCFLGQHLGQLLSPFAASYSVVGVDDQSTTDGRVVHLHLQREFEANGVRNMVQSRITLEPEHDWRCIEWEQLPSGKDGTGTRTKFEWGLCGDQWRLAKRSDEAFDVNGKVVSRGDTAVTYEKNADQLVPWLSQEMPHIQGSVDMATVATTLENVLMWSTVGLGIAATLLWGWPERKG